MNKFDNLIKITPLNISCPVCNKNELKMLYSITHIPYFGDIFVMSIKCDNCMFKISDIMAVTYESKKEHKIKICESSINDLLILSANSTVEIPELGLELTIQSEMGGEISTIEGLLMGFAEYAKMMYNQISNPESREKILDIIKTLEKEAKNPSCTLTLKIFDETGKSSIIPHELWVKRAEKERKSNEIDQIEADKLARELIKKFSKHD